MRKGAQRKVPTQRALPAIDHKAQRDKLQSILDSCAEENPYKNMPEIKAPTKTSFSIPAAARPKRIMPEKVAVLPRNKSTAVEDQENKAELPPTVLAEKKTNVKAATNRVSLIDRQKLV